MRTVGIALIILGIVGFLVTGISFTTEEDVANVGPLEVERQEEQTIPITPLAAGGAVAVGIGLLVAGQRREGGT